MASGLEQVGLLPLRLTLLCADSAHKQVDPGKLANVAEGAAELARELVVIDVKVDGGFYGGGESESGRAEDLPWHPQDVERAFASIRLLFKLAQDMAPVDSVGEAPQFSYFSTSPGPEIERERKPAELVSVRMGSLEVILSVSGALAAGKVVRYLFDLIEQAYTIRPRIRRERASLEADRLEAELRTMSPSRTWSASRRGCLT